MKKINLRKTLKTNQKGITLIALVITVIVLLILAGVSISAIGGNSGIMSKAKEAKEKTEQAQEFEKVQMATIQAIAVSNLGVINPNDNSLETLRNGLAEVVENASNISGEGPWVVIGKAGENKKKYTIKSNGDITQTDASEVALTGIEVSPLEVNLEIGGTQAITVTSTPNDATEGVEFRSNNESVATVSEAGVIKGVSAGSATITVRGKTTQNENTTKTINVTVNPNVVALTGINLESNSASILVGGIAQINATPVPPSTTESLTYTSSNPSVASVSNTGLVTGVAASNTPVTITIAGSTSTSVTATFTVTVTNPTVANVTTIAQAKEQNAVAVESGITTLKDAGNHDIKIPAGFHIASDSAIDRADGIVIEDKDGNQFVWIPVDNISSYTRTWYCGWNDASFSYYSESMPSDEQTSVTNNKGYYIGRYEAGDSDKPTKSGGSLRASGASELNAVVVQKGYAPYNYIKQAYAIARATEMKQKQGYTATTKLCSSYAWDTAINFIQGKVSNYGKSSPQGNYRDRTFSYTNIAGENTTKSTNIDILIPTGQTTAVCNIYDMGGNVEEWTTENTTYAGARYATRGGSYDNNYPAGTRGYESR